MFNNQSNLHPAGGEFDLYAAPAVAEPAAPVAAPIIDPDHFFDFEQDKVQPLTLDQLRRTVRENDGRGGQPLHGIYHFQLIDELVERCRRRGFDTEVYDMFATNNHERLTPGVSLYPELEATHGRRAVEAHSIRRLYANIRVRDFDTDTLTTCLAVSYTQRGIQLGIGRNVKVCHNQCMLGADRYVADFAVGSRKGLRLTTTELLAAVDRWMDGLRELVAGDDDTIERLRRSTLGTHDVMTIVGLLTAARVQHDTDVKDIRRSAVYPLNQTQITRFTEAMLVELKQRDSVDAWTMYNIATNLYKPHTAEQTLILPQNLAMMEFMTQWGIV